LFLQVQQLETTQLSLKICLALCNIPEGKSVHNTNTGVQTKIFMTILKPSVYQIHGLFMAC